MLTLCLIFTFTPSTNTAMGQPKTFFLLFFSDMVIDRGIFKNNQITLFPCLILIPKISLELSKTELRFYDVRVKNVAKIKLFKALFLQNVCSDRPFQTDILQKSNLTWYQCIFIRKTFSCQFNEFF